MKKRPMRLFLSEDADTQENDGPEKDPGVGAVVQDGGEDAERPPGLCECQQDRYRQDQTENPVQSLMGFRGGDIDVADDRPDDCYAQTDE